MSTDPKSNYYDFGGTEIKEVHDVLKDRLTQEQLEGYYLGTAIVYALRANFKGEKFRDFEKIGVYGNWLSELAKEVQNE